MEYSLTIVVVRQLSITMSIHHFLRSPSLLALVLLILGAHGSTTLDLGCDDIFVKASPLISAAVCRDGVALVAEHPSGDPLLYYKHGTSSQDTLDSILTRMHTIDAAGASLMTTGWRSDCHRLVDVARDLAASEAQMHSPTHSDDFYRIVAQKLSLYLATCYSSKAVRSRAKIV